MANTPRQGEAYIVLGVKKHIDGSFTPLGIGKAIDDADLQSVAASHLEPVPRFSYQPMRYRGVLLGLISIPPDRQRIVQVLGNLLSNAARHSPESSAIRVSAVREDLHVAYSVADEGRGIPSERLPFLFRKFTRIEGDERGSGFLGSGLGLAICKGIVEAHGGRIWAESEGPGMGAQFTFTLPSVEESGSGTASVPTPRSIPSS